MQYFGDYTNTPFSYRPDKWINTACNHPTLAKKIRETIEKFLQLDETQEGNQTEEVEPKNEVERQLFYFLSRDLLCGLERISGTKKWNLLRAFTKEKREELMQLTKEERVKRVEFSLQDIILSLEPQKKFLPWKTLQHHLQSDPKKHQELLGILVYTHHLEKVFSKAKVEFADLRYDHAMIWVDDVMVPEVLARGAVKMKVNEKALEEAVSDIDGLLRKSAEYFEPASIAKEHVRGAKPAVQQARPRRRFEFSTLENKWSDRLDFRRLLERQEDGAHYHKVFKHERSRLPLFQERDKIVDVINRHQVTLLVAPTGTGKTTQVPQYLLEDSWSRNKACRIICTQPRRISAVSIAERVEYERGGRVENQVGYQIRFESTADCEKTVIFFCTEGILIHHLNKDSKTLANTTHIILDEVHERGIDMDFALLVLKFILPFYPHIKLILMSATISLDLMRPYFEGVSKTRVGIVQCRPKRPFPIKDLYMEGVLQFIQQFDYALKHRDNAEDYNPIDQSVPDFVVDTSPSYAKAKNMDTFVSPFSIASPRNDSDNDMKAPAEHDELWVQFVAAKVMAHKSGDFFGMFKEKQTEFIKEFNQWRKEMDGGSPMGFEESGFGRKRSQDLAKGKFTMLRALLKAAPSKEEVLEAVNDNIEANESKIRNPFLIPTPEGRKLPLGVDPNWIASKVMKYHARAINEDLDVEFICQLVDIIHLTQQNDNKGRMGGILIFVPGWKDIADITSLLQNKSRYKNEYEVIQLHSLLGRLDQQTVFSHAPMGKRKVVVSTMIAESSITIDDITFVIDTGLTKQKHYDPVNHIASLVTVPESKSSSIQRMGRAGRVQPGMVFRLFSSFQHEAMYDMDKPEMQRMPAEEPALHYKSIKLFFPEDGKPPGIKEFLGAAISPPADFTIDAALHSLGELGAFNDKLELTPLGEKLAEMPAEPHLAKLVLFGSLFGCLDPIVTIASYLGNKDPFYRPIGEARKADNKKVEYAAGIRSDHLLMEKVSKQWRQLKPKEQIDFGRSHYVSSISMNHMGRLREQMLRLVDDFQLKDFGIGHDEFADSPELINAVLCCGLRHGRVTRGEGRHPFGILLMDSKKKAYPHPKTMLSKSNTRPKEPWVASHDVQLTKDLYCYDLSPINTLTMLLFAQHACMKGTTVIELDRDPKHRVKINSPKAVILILQLRELIHMQLIPKVLGRSAITSCHREVIQKILNLLKGQKEAGSATTVSTNNISTYGQVVEEECASSIGDFSSSDSGDDEFEEFNYSSEEGGRGGERKRKRDKVTEALVADVHGVGANFPSPKNLPPKFSTTLEEESQNRDGVKRNNLEAPSQQPALAPPGTQQQYPPQQGLGQARFSPYSSSVRGPPPSVQVPRGNMPPSNPYMASGYGYVPQAPQATMGATYYPPPIPSQLLQQAQVPPPPPTSNNIPDNVPAKKKKTSKYEKQEKKLRRQLKKLQRKKKQKNKNKRKRHGSSSGSSSSDESSSDESSSSSSSSSGFEEKKKARKH